MRHPYLELGVFAELKDFSYFKQVRIAFGTVQWPHEAGHQPGYSVSRGARRLTDPMQEDLHKATRSFRSTKIKVIILEISPAEFLDAHCCQLPNAGHFPSPNHFARSRQHVRRAPLTILDFRILST